MTTQCSGIHMIPIPPTASNRFAANPLNLQCNYDLEGACCTMRTMPIGHNSLEETRKRQTHQTHDRPPLLVVILSNHKSDISKSKSSCDSMRWRGASTANLIFAIGNWRFSSRVRVLGWVLGRFCKGPGTGSWGESWRESWGESRGGSWDPGLIPGHPGASQGLS